VLSPWPLCSASGARGFPCDVRRVVDRARGLPSVRRGTLRGLLRFRSPAPLLELDPVRLHHGTDVRNGVARPANPVRPHVPNERGLGMLEHMLKARPAESEERRKLGKGGEWLSRREEGRLVAGSLLVRSGSRLR
jgi:hypothetical protein